MGKAYLLLWLSLILVSGCTFQKAIRGGDVVDRYDIRTYSLPIEEVYYKNLDGTPLYAWFIKAGDYKEKPTLLFLHGSEGDLLDYLPVIANLYDFLHVNIFACDFPGSGASRGEMSLNNTYRMTLAALDYLESRNDIRRDKIALFGVSIGAALAYHGGSEQQRIPIIVDSGVTSAGDYVESHYFPPGLPDFLIDLIGEDFDNYYPAKTIRNPKLFLHGRQDDIIDIAYARRLYDEALEPKAFLWVNGEHVLFENKAKAQELAKTVQAFLRRYLPE